MNLCRTPPPSLKYVSGAPGEGCHLNKQIEQVITQVKYFFTVVRCVTVKCYSLYLYSDFYYCRIRRQSILNFTIQHPRHPPPSPPPGQPLGHLNFLNGQVHDIVHVWVWQYLIFFKTIGSKLDARREIYAGVFLDVWFYFICPYNSCSLLFLRYVLQLVRIRFTALSYSETNIYLRVFLWGLLHTHANKAVTDWQTKINL